MHSTPVAPSPRSSPASALLTILVAVSIACLVFLIANGPGLQSQVLPPEAAKILHHLIVKTRQSLSAFIPLSIPPCALGEICQEGAERPMLANGLPSHSVWDLPRNLMKGKFADVTKTIATAQVNYMWEEPLVVYYDNVLSEEEINLLVESATPKFKQSMVVGPDGTYQADNTRTSDTAWLFMGEDPAFRFIVDKVSALAGFTSDHCEHIGVNRYKPSQYFNPHHDFLLEHQLFQGEFSGCQRASTALIYLNDVEEGGDTMFTRTSDMDGRFNFDPDNPNHLKVKPKRGRVLIWYDMHPFTENVDHTTLHGGSPVVKGVKMAATIFIRNCTRAESTLRSQNINAQPTSDNKKTTDEPSAQTSKDMGNIETGEQPKQDL